MWNYFLPYGWKPEDMNCVLHTEEYPRKIQVNVWTPSKIHWIPLLTIKMKPYWHRHPAPPLQSRWKMLKLQTHSNETKWTQTENVHWWHQIQWRDTLWRNVCRRPANDLYILLRNKVYSCRVPKETIIKIGMEDYQKFMDPNIFQATNPTISLQSDELQYQFYEVNPRSIWNQN